MDKEIRSLIKKEIRRQNEGIELIASENYASKEIRFMTGSILTNKYAEGYPDKRYYGGCQYIQKRTNLYHQTKTRIALHNHLHQRKP